MQEKNVASGTATLYVRVSGPATAERALIVIAGGPGASHHYIRALEQMANDKRRVALFDQRGVGSSTAPADSDYSLPRYADDVEAIRKTIGVEKVDLLGHSFGGLVAMEYVNRFPQHVRSIAFVDSVPPTDKELGPTFQAMQNAMKERMQQGLMAPPPAPEGSDGTRMLRAIMPGYFADPRFAIPDYALETRFDVMINGKTSASYKGYDRTADLKKVMVPVLVMAGEADAFAAVAGSLAGAFSPGIATVKGLPACGHMPFIECPAAFFSTLEEFLN